jgi:MerR family transcriptional regulator/heat shock protein HspR
LYTDQDLERLDVILTLARDMGVNLAGIEIILNMREKMVEMERQMEEFTHVVQQELARVATMRDERVPRHAIVRAAPRLVRGGREA